MGVDNRESAQSALFMDSRGGGLLGLGCDHRLCCQVRVLNARSVSRSPDLLESCRGCATDGPCVPDAASDPTPPVGSAVLRWDVRLAPAAGGTRW